MVFPREFISIHDRPKERFQPTLSWVSREVDCSRLQSMGQGLLGGVQAVDRQLHHWRVSPASFPQHVFVIYICPPFLLPSVSHCCSSPSTPHSLVLTPSVSCVFFFLCCHLGTVQSKPKPPLWEIGVTEGVFFFSSKPFSFIQLCILWLHSKFTASSVFLLRQTKLADFSLMMLSSSWSQGRWNQDGRV